MLFLNKNSVLNVSANFWLKRTLKSWKYFKVSEKAAKFDFISKTVEDWNNYFGLLKRPCLYFECPFWNSNLKWNLAFDWWSQACWYFHEFSVVVSNMRQILTFWKSNEFALLTTQVDSHIFHNPGFKEFYRSAALSWLAKKCFRYTWLVHPFQMKGCVFQ